MGVADTKPERTAARSPELEAQAESFQHLDEPEAAAAADRARGDTPSTTGAATATAGRVDDARVTQALIGGPATTRPAGRDPVAHLRPPTQPSWFDKIEAFVSRLSVRDNFWNSICSLIWLPLAFFSGIRMKELEPGSFAAQAILPFRRFNRNWYRAMAGGALLANSEIAGGTYVFGICGADYTVVCKNLNYTFLRPCMGPAVYRMTARENVKQLVAAGGEFNVTLDMDISQQGFRGERDRRVGKCEATFHVTPKVHHKAKRARKKK
jgi:acyl-coenzyme A thioesterase PaaI-like protein